MQHAHGAVSFQTDHMSPRVPPRNDVPDEQIRTKDGVIPYRWLERVAICVESGMSERDATRLANLELSREGTYVPNR